MLNVYIRPQPAVAGVPATAATAAETSSDEILVERIAAGDKLAMQALFARHRTSVYRWLVRFVSNETLAEDLLSEVFLGVWRQAARFECRSYCKNRHVLCAKEIGRVGQRGRGSPLFR